MPIRQNTVPLFSVLFKDYSTCQFSDIGPLTFWEVAVVAVHLKGIQGTDL